MEYKKIYFPRELPLNINRWTLSGVNMFYLDIRDKKVRRMAWFLVISLVFLYIGKVSWNNYKLFSNLGNLDPKTWERKILDYEISDRQNRPKYGQIVFIGSSTITNWKNLKFDMSPMPVLNRGFGGAKLSDILYYSQRMILAYRPSMVVIYAGTNDLTRVGMTPDGLRDMYHEVVTLIHEALPDCIVYYVSIKPTTHNSKFWEVQKKANKLIQEYSESSENVEFIDIASLMMEEDGNLKSQYISWDGLHLSPHGYHLWADTIKHALEKNYYNTSVKK